MFRLWSLPALALCMIQMACGPAPKLPAVVSAQTRLQQATDYLVSSQDADGGWHSPTHGFLRDGQAWTPFVLYQLASANARGAVSVPDSVFEKGARFIRDHVTEEGVLGLHDPDLQEYPNYSTSYALRTMMRIGSKDDRELVESMAAYLLKQQYTEQRSISPDNVAYGSWGFGEKVVSEGAVGHVDLSHTRRVIEALGEYAEFLSQDNSPDGDKREAIQLALERSRLFLASVQKHPSDSRVVVGDLPQNRAPYDGGFYSSSVVHGTNKAGMATLSDGTQYFVSYATTTCDGLISLLATGLAKGDERVHAAATWLARNPGLDRPEGIAPGLPGDWDLVMYYYHLASRATAYEALDSPGNWREEIASHVDKYAIGPGKYSNPNGGLNKEDDPILATALVVEALTTVVGDGQGFLSKPSEKGL